MTPIITQRLLLETLRESHAEKLWPVLADPRIYCFLDTLPPASQEVLAVRFRKLEVGRSVGNEEVWMNWMIETTEGRCIGFVQATVHVDRTAAIAFVVGADHWGKGYGSEATDAMLRHLVESFSIRAAFATVDSRNVRSQNLL